MTTKMINATQLGNRKEELKNDILLVQQRLQEGEQKKLEDTALLNALTGALQQCDIFLKELHNDDPEKDGDDGNENNGSQRTGSNATDGHGGTGTAAGAGGGASTATQIPMGGIPQPFPGFFDTFLTSTTVAETIEEISGKVIIWARFRKDIQDIVKALQKQYGEGSAGAYYGSTEPKVRELLIDRFQSSSEACRFFVGNPQTAGFGLTLTAASNVIYYSNDFNLENRVQSEDRCHRIGQKNKVTYIDLMTRNSIDQYIVKKLQSKIKIASKTLGEELKEWLEI